MIRAQNVLALAVLAALLAIAEGRAEEPRTLTIGVLEANWGGRYDDAKAYARILLRPVGRPARGAEAGVDEVNRTGRLLGFRFELARRETRSGDELVAALNGLYAKDGVRLFLLDAPDAAVAALARATAGRDLLLFNVAARGEALRGRDCQPNLFHTIASDAMRMDGLAQYLAARKWRKVLVLEGPLAGDKVLARAFARAAKRFGLKIVATRPFVLSNDPRERERNNIALLTGGVRYDAVFVADGDGEFARYVPYQTARPRPVVGAAGLAAGGWHWSWERHGAPQLNRRFEKRAKRRMQEADWAAWAAIKAIAEAAVRTGSLAPRRIALHLKSGEMVLDGYKGAPLDFRPWNLQLRQPIFLFTHNAVIARAPLRGFLHPTNRLDTLGLDREESACKF